MSSSGDSGGTGDQRAEMRYAPYIEERHEAFLDVTATRRAAAIDTSPYSGLTDIEVDLAFFGTGYTIASFPTLYDMYGKFMAGLDIEVLWDQMFEDTVNASEIGTLVAAESSLLSDEIENESYPRLSAGYRDINAVMTSSFIIGKSILEENRNKQVAKFSAELKYRMIPVAVEKWRSHLSWNEAVIRNYMEVMKLYYTIKIDIDSYNNEVSVKDALWPFTVLDFERANLGVLQGAQTSTQDVKGASQGQKALGGALSGAAAGAAIGGGPGAAIGGFLGAAASFL